MLEQVEQDEAVQEWQRMKSRHDTPGGGTTFRNFVAGVRGQAAPGSPHSVATDSGPEGLADVLS